MDKLNFGCGTDIKAGFDNVDLKDFDFNKFPYPIEDNHYEYIFVNHVLEHLEKPEKVLDELQRISIPNGIIEINVPHFNSEGAFSEVGHINFFTRKWFECYANPPSWRKAQTIEIIYLEEFPSWFGFFIYPKWLRRKLSLLCRGIFVEIKIKFMVRK